MFLLAWTPLPSAVAPEVVLDAPPPAESFDGPASIATDGEGAFVTTIRRGTRDWDRFFYGGSLDANGVPAFDSSFIGATDNHGRGADPVIASSGNGKGYMVVYGSAMKTYAVRVTTSGRRGETVELPAESVSDIAWDGSSFVVLTGNNAFRLSETAQVLETNIPLAGTRIASRNGVTVAIANTGNLSARTLTGGTVGQSVNVAPVAVTFDVAAGDPGFLVVYDAGGAVFGRLLDPSGNPDGFSFPIAAGGKSPSAVWNGTEWTVAYEAASSVRATRVLRGPVSPSFLIDESGATPAVAANGSTVYITWRSSFGGNQSATIEGEQVTQRGAAPRGRVPQTSPRIATVANAPLVVWHDGSTRLRRMDGVSPTQSIEESGTPAALASRGNEALVVLVDSQGDDPRHRRRLRCPEKDHASHSNLRNPIRRRDLGRRQLSRRVERVDRRRRSVHGAGDRGWRDGPTEIHRATPGLDEWNCRRDGRRHDARSLERRKRRSVHDRLPDPRRGGRQDEVACPFQRSVAGDDQGNFLTAQSARRDPRMGRAAA